MNNSGIVAGLATTALAVGIIALAPKPNPTSTPSSGLATWDHVHPLASLTPGVVDPKLTFEVLSAPGFMTKTYRNVPESEKEQVYREYGLDPRHHEPAEVDHFISIELGGSNEIGNLWPESYSLNANGLEMGAHEKDKAEDVMGRLVKSGKLPLAQAQTEIRTDWTTAYRKYVGEFPKFTGTVDGRPEGE